MKCYFIQTLADGRGWGGGRVGVGEGLHSVSVVFAYEET